MTLQETLYNICDDIEATAAKIAGIDTVFSDYWLVTIPDWCKDDEEAGKVVEELAQKYGIGDDRLGCFTHYPVMLTALYVYLESQKHEK